MAATSVDAQEPVLSWHGVVAEVGFLAHVPACAPPTVAAEGWTPWRAQGTNDAVLLPPGFRRVAANAWTDGMRTVTIADEDAPFAFTEADLAARCMSTWDHARP